MKNKLWIILLVVAVVFSFAQAETCRHVNISYNVMLNAVRHGDVCQDCGKILFTSEHAAACTEPGVCRECGYESAVMEIYHNLASRDKGGECETYCLDCGITQGIDPHEGSCTNPGICYYCGYESADILNFRHADGGAFLDNGGKCALVCGDCGQICKVLTHAAKCSSPNECYRCGYESDQLEIDLHDFSYRDNGGKCEEYCLFCKTISSVTSHEVNCAMPGVCTRCGFEVEVENETHDFIEYHNSSEGKCEGYCLNCGEIVYSAAHSAHCTAPGACLRCAFESDDIGLSHNEAYRLSSTGCCEKYCSDCGKVFGTGDHISLCDNPGVCMNCSHHSSDLPAVHYSDCYSQDTCYICGATDEDCSFEHRSFSGYLYDYSDGTTHTTICTGCSYSRTEQHIPFEESPSVCLSCGGEIYSQSADPRESIYASVYFRPYYLAKNPDLAAAFGDDRTATMDHFINSGMDEGRAASAEFSWKIYRANYPDLAAAFGNDPRSYYEHYISSGKAEGRVANQLISTAVPEQPDVTDAEAPYAAVYNYNYYISQYADVAAAFNRDRAATLDHFLTCGMAEGRQGNDSFNVNYYRANYADLEAAFGSDLKAYFMHFIRNGKAEDRVADKPLSSAAPEQPVDPEQPSVADREAHYAPVYDFDYYVDRYPDVAAAFNRDRAATLDHFVHHGMSEGRQGCAEFNVQTYRANYADLEAAFGSDLKDYYKHYINYGKSENRSGR